MNDSMKLSQFKFNLPQELLAQHPAEFRDDARMLVLHRKTGEIEHKHVKDVIDYFDDGDAFIFNDSQVFPARLYGNKEKTGALIEVFLLRELNADMRLWDVLVDPARKIRIGNKLYFGEDNSLVAEVIDNTTSRGRTLRFLYDGDRDKTLRESHEEFKQSLYSLGEAPLTDEVRKFRKAVPEDMEKCQTIFAKHEGAVTSPATGLHFSRELMKRMEIKGIDFAYVTMHCGLGNFREIDVEDLTKHKMDSEEMHVNKEACDAVNKAKETGHKICAVGTTVQRVLETAVSADGKIKEFDGWTNRFIFPPYEFQLADAMVANFYMPQSTMLMLTCAYGGYERIMKAYNEALHDKRYRFGVYGDAMLIIQD